MDRRESLKATGLIIGNVLTPAFLGAFFQKCTTIKESGEDWVPEFFEPEQGKVLMDAVDLIIPRTDTPGAKDANVHVFIDLFVRDCYNEEQQDVFKNGLYGLVKSGFLKFEKTKQLETLQGMEKQSWENNMTGDTSFSKMLKSLTVFAYFNSHEGATKAAEYVAAPGPFQGCIDLKPGQKVAALS